MNLTDILWWASTAAALCAAAVFTWKGLLKTYRWFGVYLWFAVARDLGLRMIGGVWSTRYAYAWAWTDILADILMVLVTYELFSLIAAHYRDFAQAGRRLLILAAAAATIACAASVAPDLKGMSWQRPFFELVVLERRCIASISAVFILLAAGFFQFYRVPFRKNVVTHGRVLALYFAMYAVSALVLNASRSQMIRIVNLTVLSMTAVCYGLWAVLMTREGEMAPASPLPDEERQRALFEQTGALIDGIKNVKPR